MEQLYSLPESFKTQSKDLLNSTESKENKDKFISNKDIDAAFDEQEKKKQKEDKDIQNDNNKEVIVNAEKNNTESAQNTESKENIQNEEDDNKETTFSVLAKEFAQKGLYNLEENEEFDGSEESFIKGFEKTVDKKADEKVLSYFEGHPQADLALNLFNYIKDGGDINNFVEVYSNPLQNINIEDKNSQIYILTQYLRQTTSLSDDKIQQKIKRYDDLATLEEEAKDAYEVLSQLNERNRTQFQEQEKVRVARIQQERQEAEHNIKDFINKNESIKGILNIKDARIKKKFEDYLFKPTELVNGRLVPKSWVDDSKSSVENWLTDKALKFLNYDLSSVSKQKEKETVTNLVKNLKKVSSENSRVKSSGISTEEEERQEASRKQKDELWSSLLSNKQNLLK